MDVIREREVKDSLERQLVDEKRLRGKQRALCFIIIIFLFNLLDETINRQSFARHPTNAGLLGECVLVFIYILNWISKLYLEESTGDEDNLDSLFRFLYYELCFVPARGEQFGEIIHK